MNNKPIKGRSAILTSLQLDTLSEYVKQSASSSEGGRLVWEDIAQYIYEQFNVRYHTDLFTNCLRSLGLAGSQAVLSTQSSQKKAKRLLKKSKWKRSFRPPGHLLLGRIDVCFQNEARFGQQNQITCLWAETGSRPRATKQQQFEYGYLFGAVCPRNGITEALISPVVNKDVMT